MPSKIKTSLILLIWIVSPPLVPVPNVCVRLCNRDFVVKRCPCSAVCYDCVQYQPIVYCTISKSSFNSLGHLPATYCVLIWGGGCIDRRMQCYSTPSLPFNLGRWVMMQVAVCLCVQSLADCFFFLNMYCSDKQLFLYLCVPLFGKYLSIAKPCVFIYKCVNATVTFLF